MTDLDILGDEFKQVGRAKTWGENRFPLFLQHRFFNNTNPNKYEKEDFTITDIGFAGLRSDRMGAGPQSGESQRCDSLSREF